MIDLVALVADKNMEAALTEILDRWQSLGIRRIEFEIIRHPNSDPGCFHHFDDLLPGYRTRARRALLLMDRDWEGAPARTGPELEGLLEISLESAGLHSWVRPIVIDPELEAWIFSDSPHVSACLGWQGSTGDLVDALRKERLWVSGEGKPRNPKAAALWALRRARRPLSSAIFREIASRVSFERCTDGSFLRLKDTLVEWFRDSKAKE